MALVVTCPCGHISRADNEDELVKLVIKHGEEVHNQTPSREQIMAMAKPEE